MRRQTAAPSLPRLWYRDCQYFTLRRLQRQARPAHPGDELVTVPVVDPQLRDALVALGRGQLPELGNDEIVERVLQDAASRAGTKGEFTGSWCYVAFHRDDGLQIIEASDLDDLPIEVVAFAVVPLGNDPVSTEVLEDDAAQRLIDEIEWREEEQRRGPPRRGKSRWWGGERCVDCDTTQRITVDRVTNDIVCRSCLARRAMERD